VVATARRMHDRAPLRVTGVPARHGPPGCEPTTGPVTGFVLTADGLPSVYVSGDNAALEHVGAVADRFGPVDVAILFTGAARTALLDGAYLTLTSAQAAQAAQAAAVLGARHVVPLHFADWAHFSQGRDTLEKAFTTAGLRDRRSGGGCVSWPKGATDHPVITANESCPRAAAGSQPGGRRWPRLVSVNSGRFKEIPDWPVAWSALHGLSELKPPVLKALTWTAPSHDLQVVRWMGERSPSGAQLGCIFRTSEAQDAG
jgi:hypothetical protein